MRSSFILKKLQLLTLIAKDRSVSRCAIATASVIINNYNHKTGRCFPSYSYIANHTHYSVRQVKKSIGKIVPKYILNPTKGHTGWANTYKPRFELLKQLKSNSLKDLKVVNFEVKDGELETYNPVNPAALQTINKTFNKTESEMERLKGLAPLVNMGMNFSTLSQVDLEAMDRMGLLDKK